MIDGRHDSPYLCDVRRTRTEEQLVVTTREHATGLDQGLNDRNNVISQPVPQLDDLQSLGESRRADDESGKQHDQDTGEYLVQALGGAPGASSHLLATLAEANCLVVVPSEAEQVRTGETVDVAFLAQRG